MSELEKEQAHVDRAYARLEEIVAQARKLAADAAARRTAAVGPTRDVLVETGLRRAAQLDIGDEPLVFGRTDAQDATTHHIGRVGIHDTDYSPLVVDWRAPAAEPFYRATPREPLGLVRRRHIHCRRNKVLHLEDELLDEKRGASSGLELVGEGALLAALGRGRTGRMRDIVATIQREQDEIIRAPLEGVLVVQGGPGTGKTAVALHRAAYLLYAHRRRLQRRGVLVVGPNPIFLRYIDRVLPSLGETASLGSLATMVGGVRVAATDPPASARLKGDARMADVIERAVRDIERGLDGPVTIRYGQRELVLTPRATRHAVKVAQRRLRTPHNVRRRDVRELLILHLVRWHRETDEEFADLVGRDERRSLERFLREDETFARALDDIWPVVAAPDLVLRLLHAPDVLARAGEDILTSEEQEVLHRSPTAWTEADVALIDEAEQHLGGVRTRGRRAPEIDEEERFGIERMLDELGEVNPVIRAEREHLARRLLNQRADLEDREPGENPSSRFGHVIVDEAQTVTPMQWRMIARRCPSGSMTIVGDLGQGDAITSWEEIFRHLPSVERRVAELTINYRTPAEIMDLAARVLRATGAGLEPPRSVRSTGEQPEIREVAPGELEQATAGAARRAVEELDEGTVGVIAPDALTDAIRAAVGSHRGHELLDEPVAVLGLDDARGLEFDVAIVVEPAAIVRERGLRALYVAMTRPTQRLVFVHAEPLPDVLR